MRAHGSMASRKLPIDVAQQYPLWKLAKQTSGYQETTSRVSGIDPRRLTIRMLF